MAEAAAPAARLSQFDRGGRHPLVGFLARFSKNPLGVIFSVVIVALVFLSLSAQWVAPHDPLEVFVGPPFEGPSLAHPFGTDNIGRDQLSRIIHGARITLYVGLLAVFSGVTVGAVVGLVSGYFGGVVDMVVQRIVDGLLALPGIVLAMSIVSVIGSSSTNATLAIAVLIAPSTSRVIRGAVLSVRHSTYVEAANVIGAGNLRIMLRHVLPNVVAPILILVSASLGNAILVIAGLSFLGLATQPPEPSWGLMLATSGREYMERAPWLAIFPGLAISITVLAFNMVGDTVRDVLDPKLRGTS